MVDKPVIHRYPPGPMTSKIHLLGFSSHLSILMAVDPCLSPPIDAFQLGRPDRDCLPSSQLKIKLCFGITLQSGDRSSPDESLRVAAYFKNTPGSSIEPQACYGGL